MVQLKDLQAKVGEIIGTSEWFEIGQGRITRFADITEDSGVLSERAQGFLMLSMLAPMLPSACERVEVSVSVNYGFDKVRFLSPVKPDQRIRGRFRLLELAEKRAGQWLQRVEATVEVEGEDTHALVAEWLFQHFA
jgi:acyl dehydratase